MSTLAIEIPQSRVTPIDALLVAVWAAIFTIGLAAHASDFLMYTLAGGGILVARHFYGVFADGQRSDGNLAIAALAPVFLMCSHLGLSSVNRITPVTFDALLAGMDLGIAPAVRAWALTHGWADCIIEAAYSALPLAMMIGIGATTGAQRKRLLCATALGGLLVIPWYVILPAVGPAHVGDPSAPRNCMPSMHVTWALLIFMNSRGKARLLAGVFVALTAAATLATGEHYSPDLVAALPWAWAMNKLGEKVAA